MVMHGRYAYGLSAGVVALSLASFAVQHHRAQARTLRSCRDDDLSIRSTDAHQVGADVVAVTALGSWGTSPCLLHERLRFAVKPVTARWSPRGAIRGIRGNPATTLVKAVLEPGSVHVYAWRWRNWCGAHGKGVLQASWRGALVPSQAVKAPRCTAKRAPAILGRVKPSIRRCAVADYRATTDLGQPFRTALIDFVQIAPLPHRTPCLLKRVKITFAVEGQSGGGDWATLRQVRGNPASRTIGGMLTSTYGAVGVFWAWTNWCGGGDHFRPVAVVNGRTVTGSSKSQAATCEDPTMPSTLSPSYGHLP
jgi:hypothetical protein